MRCPAHFGLYFPTSQDLATAALRFGALTLRPGGHMVCKFYAGAEDRSLESQFRALFHRVSREKPTASRSESKEMYFVGLRRKGDVGVDDDIKPQRPLLPNYIREKLSNPILTEHQRSIEAELGDMILQDRAPDDEDTLEPHDAARKSYSSSSGLLSQDGEEPTTEELAVLPRVADSLPWSAYLVALIELCERFAYYGLNGPFQNYIQNPPDSSKVKGGIGLGQVGATSLTNFFQFWCYLTPLLGAVISDQYLGKYKTILLFAVIYMFGLLVLFVTSLPVAIANGASLPGLIVAMIVIGLGTGGIKSNVSPLIAEQYRGTKATVRTLKNGSRVIIDPTVTIQRGRCHPFTVDQPCAMPRR
ncbi:MAG: hypothetical protein M1825_004519 [Sarcosagium campestre]|nr:MAG: hypothetical protein M1825_004519 [Sarcosagium campestre]